MSSVWNNLIGSFAIGFLFGNGLPHLIRGITKQDYPCKAGNGPLPNFLGGWISCIIIVGLYHAIQPDPSSWVSIAAFFGGFLITGLFHATIGSQGVDRPKRSRA